VPDDVPDHQGDPAAGARDNVEPVAADTGVRVGRQVAGGHFEHAGARQAVGQQFALQGERGCPLAAVAEGVVEAQRCPRREVLGEDEVGPVEGSRVLGADEDSDAKHHPPRAQRNDWTEM
jgi:hypothetical protein